MSSDAPAPVLDAPPERQDVAIEVVGLGKRYEIYDRPYQRLLQTILRGRRTFYRDFWALHDVSLTVRRGETVGLVGRNGSGKSTLLQLVAGTLHPTTGTVRTHGRIAALLELGSGFNPEFSGRENVFLNGAILGITRRQMSEVISDIEAFAEIGDFIDQPVKTYSSGMIVRLAFAVSVHVMPEILIVDEALAVGDTAFQSKCLARIREMQRAGVAILLVSHAPNTVIEFCDRAAYLDRGRLVALGSCRDILEMYANDVVSSDGGAALPGASAHQGEGETEKAPSSLPSPRPIGTRPATEIVGVAIVDSSGAPAQSFANGDALEIRVDAEYHGDNPAPCLGIQLRSPDDIVLWTCTTQILDLQLAPVAAGTRVTYVWRLRANFGGGRYVISLGIGDCANGSYRRHSRMHYAGHFDVLPQARRGSGWVEPEASFSKHA